MEYNISFYKETHIIPIQASLILVIPLSCTYYLPLRLKIGLKALWNTVLGFTIDTGGGVSIVNELWVLKKKIYSVNYTKAPLCFYLSSPQEELCRSAARTWAHSRYFTEIHSIADCETARAPHVCHVKTGNGPICRDPNPLSSCWDSNNILVSGFQLWSCGALWSTYIKQGRIWRGVMGYMGNVYSYNYCMREG